jgi:hypothetical protein
MRAVDQMMTDSSYSEDRRCLTQPNRAPRRQRFDRRTYRNELIVARAAILDGLVDRTVGLQTPGDARGSSFCANAFLTRPNVDARRRISQIVRQRVEAIRPLQGSRSSR